MMDRIIFLYLACILAGFALLKVPFIYVISSLEPVISLIAVIAIIVFSFLILFKGVLALLGR